MVAESEISLDTLPIAKLKSLKKLYLSTYFYISEYDKPKTQQQTQQFEEMC